MTTGASTSERQRLSVLDPPAPDAQARCRIELTTKMDGGVAYWSLVATSISGEPEELPEIKVGWYERLVDVAAIWTTGAGRNKGLPPEWSPAAAVSMSKATSQAPIACAVSGDGRSRVCIASSEVVFEAKLEVGVLEETAELRCVATFFLSPRGKTARAEVVLRIDRREQRYERALGDVAGWWASLPGCAPMPVPDAARLPAYSTWYSFHQQLDPATIEAECALARELGCGAVIVDDGWQTLDASRGYAYCGDWEPERIPDLAAHVARVQALGLKYLLWFSVPFVGKRSRAFERFRDKLLYIHEPLAAGVLDPRFPDVREAVIETYERAMKTYGLDGVKLDFVDRFKLGEHPSGAAGRDYDSPEEAAVRLLADAVSRLRSIDRDVLVEFRQPYVGPAMRAHGNMFRAADCPSDLVRNRVSTIDIRLLCGATACHSDMIMWSPDEPAEAAALQLLAVLFSVPQISVRIEALPDEHREMLRFWLGFWRAHRETLLDGRLDCESPELNYTQARATSPRESVVVAYAPVVIALPAEDEILVRRDLFVVNATRRPGVVVEVASSFEEADRTASIFDACGRCIDRSSVRIGPGVRSFAVPPAGLVAISE